MNLSKKSMLEFVRNCQSTSKLYFAFLISAGMFLLSNGCKVKPSPDSKKDQSVEMSGGANNVAVDPGKGNSDKARLPFSLHESFSQEWTSGIYNGGRSTEYTFRMIIHTAEKLEFDSAWIGENAFKVYLANTSKVISNRPVTFAQNDTASVRVSFSSNAKHNLTPAPVKFAGAALISYRISGKTGYFEIDSIEKKPPIQGQ